MLHPLGECESTLPTSAAHRALTAWPRSGKAITYSAPMLRGPSRKLKAVFNLQDPPDHQLLPHRRLITTSTAAPDLAPLETHPDVVLSTRLEVILLCAGGLEWMISRDPLQHLLFCATLQNQQQPLPGRLAAAPSPGQQLLCHRSDDRALPASAVLSRGTTGTAGPPDQCTDCFCSSCPSDVTGAISGCVAPPAGASSSQVVRSDAYSCI